MFGSAHTIGIFRKRWRVLGGGWQGLVFVDLHSGLWTDSHLDVVLVLLIGGAQEEGHDKPYGQDRIAFKQLAFRRRTPKGEV